MTPKTITVVGAGIIGLWQAMRLAKAGHVVRLIDKEIEPALSNASRFGATMLAPDCESETAPDIVSKLGHAGLQIWKKHFPDVSIDGTLVVANPRDQPDLARFARLTKGFEHIEGEQLAALEPEIEKRFSSALYFKNEAHLQTEEILTQLQSACASVGVVHRYGVAWTSGTWLGGLGENDLIVDCRGIAARRDLPSLRGVRGERLIVRANEVNLRRPIRLIHPRHPIYVVPWNDGRFVIGATVIESEDDGPATVRSVLELLGAAYALHPGFGEAVVVNIGAGVRPAFPDNVPRIIIDDTGSVIRVNGAYRHGYLLAPVLADAVANYVETGSTTHPLVHRRTERITAPSEPGA